MIKPGCSIALGRDFAAADFTASGSSTAAATINCNTSFVIRATSANGAVVSPVAPPPQFTNRLPYTVSLTVPLNAGGQVSASCLSSTLMAGQAGCALSPAGSGLSSGAGGATGKTATLAAQWTAPTATRLIAGRYADTITLSIAARP